MICVRLLKSLKARNRACSLISCYAYGVRLRAISVSLLLLFTSPTFGSSLCEIVESSGEGHWPIAEEKFTQENAILAAKELQQIVGDLDKGDMFLVRKYSLDRESLLENNYLIITGYALKTSVLSAMKDDPKNIESHRQRFCKFLVNEAMVRH